MANYWMKAWQNVLLTTVHWLAEGQPDWLGTFSGQPPAQLDDIIVLQVIQTAGVEPGTGGGPWQYPGMTLEPYDPAAIDLDSEFAKFEYDYADFMTEGDAPSGDLISTLASGWGTGDLTDLYEHP